MGGAQTYQGNPLSQNVQSAYTSALGQSGGVANAGADILGQAGGFGTQAGDLYSAMGGYAPSDVEAGQLSTTDLSPYMNPFTQGVIDTTMGELTRQEGIAQQGIDDAALGQNAFGGDRMYMQKGKLGGDFLRTKAQTLADLYMKNFANAQQMGQFDISNRLGAAQGNQGMRTNLYGQAGQGLGGLAGMYGQLGAGMNQFGISNLGNLANMGFGFGDTLQKNQLAAGALQQQQQQQLMDAIKAQYAGYANAPTDSLAAFLGAITSAPGGYGKTTSSTNPGALSILGTAGSVLGSFF